MNSETKDFVAYEYLSLNVNSSKFPLYLDCYENFGWILVNNAALVDKEDYYINNYNSKGLVNIQFKRDRKIKNKTQLTSLQRKLEASLKEIEKLEKEPNTDGIVKSMSVGVIGTIFLAISVFLITVTNPLYILSVISGIIGIVGWILPYFVYKKVKLNKEHDNLALIEEEYNSVYDCCEQARKLIN